MTGHHYTFLDWSPFFSLAMKTQENPAQQIPILGEPRRKRRTASHSASNSRSEEPSLMRSLLNALDALKNGDFAVRLPLDWTGMAGEVASHFNAVVTSNERTAQELGQLRQAVGNTSVLLNALTALKGGDFSVRLPLDWVGIAGKTADTFNEVVTLNQRMAQGIGSASPIGRTRGPDQPTRFAR